MLADVEIPVHLGVASFPWQRVPNYVRYGHVYMCLICVICYCQLSWFECKMFPIAGASPITFQGLSAEILTLPESTKPWLPPKINGRMITSSI